MNTVRFATSVLTGKINDNTTFEKSDFRNTVPRFSPENRKANQPLVDLVIRLAAKKKATPAQVALGWLLAKNFLPTPSIFFRTTQERPRSG